ncbi:MAG: hypothetical protein A2509_03075 [Candidatus Edwardsbacteria bacterium RIFOXYD12_FULL_50_11]|uniref:Uncharacterized protein n=1 Tax=Candidatus Edwardsbacteria bacterium GWF2_54_11 TaxID=1817851 RepID=A0A1F5RHY4_9BACT|nr:MAG: hypothetical protein A2502_06940 [Candidatus Edwardsbacteria bacterium RifOxyC12_full_54_24]OGF06969.1 MAG: hypothetical protein A2273_08490 [Candidatus Edwardsbacteria bacterium RifOxyA12_full_54_48]OGF11065.1 MAG: hypothetical protein A3K15_08020 [Candidatus Edwardsbacteria bacterium GWE2_54_12]OGF14036.1 MAG: hypothetical protein A2024_05745 [Candidatus Edwardsbacteria bacterium GWF2_54_11]OGF16011.1 MAG: hypothetical protein A2509_03075 [Candidatus Edwardsbacteria bacterium RIFOXYD1
MSRGKRRSPSQLIGIKGEKIFEDWATNRRLTTNKAEEDYGIDYFCQVFNPFVNRANEITGHTLMVQVRSIEGSSKKRITLNKIDAENLLRQSNATCLIGVNIINRMVHYRFLNKEFIDKLIDFIGSGNSTYSINLDEMESDFNIFDELLTYHTKPGVIHGLMLYKNEKQINQAIPGATVTMHQSRDSSYAIIDLPWINSVLNIQPELFSEVRSLIFEQGKQPHELPGVDIDPEIYKILDLVDGEVYISGGSEKEANLTVEYNGIKASEKFIYRRLRDERAFTHPIGLSLRISDRRKKGDIFIHELECCLFDSTMSLGSNHDMLAFLKLLNEGAKFELDGEPFLKIDDFGKRASHIGQAIISLENITKYLNISMEDYFLNDLLNEELDRSVYLLEAVCIKKEAINKYIKGFIYGPLADGNIDEIKTKEGLFEVPVVLNLKNKGVVLWIKVKGILYIDAEGKISGFRFDEQISWKYMITERMNKSVYPELWVINEWPPIELGKAHSRKEKLDTKEPGYIKHNVKVWGKDKQKVF